jgi:DNA-binding protein HU-beta
MRMGKNPEKSAFLRIFLFTPGLRILYHLVANAGFKGLLEKRPLGMVVCERKWSVHFFPEARGVRIVRENQNKRSIMAATKMTQSQLIKELAAAVEVPNKVAKAFTVAYAELAIKETKKSGMSILPGIGRLVRVDRKARIGRNPATGEAIKIPAKKVVKFRVAKAVKDAIVPPKVKK